MPTPATACGQSSPSLSRMMKKRKWFKTAEDIATEFMGSEMTDDEIPLVVTSSEDRLIESLFEIRLAMGMCTYQKDITSFTNKEKWDNFLSMLEKQGFNITAHWKNSGIVFNEGAEFFKFNVDDNTTGITLIGTKEFNSVMEGLIREYLDICEYNMKWVWSKDGDYLNIPIKHDKLPIDEMYPFLNGKTLTQYYDDYLESDSSMLLLIGPPGTGKTSFLKGLLNYAKSSAIVSYDPNIMSSDGFFVDFLRDKTKFLIMEDCDSFLKDRQDGNDMMHRFLNVSDGLVTVKGKKLVFTTNLPSIRDIDPALIRPGRCHDIINFEPLSKANAQKLADKEGLELQKDQDEYTIADVYCGVQEVREVEESPSTGRVGF